MEEQLTILAIEDDVVDAKLLRRHLGDKPGVSLVFADRLSEGLKHLDEGGVDRPVAA